MGKHLCFWWRDTTDNDRHVDTCCEEPQKGEGGGWVIWRSKWMKADRKGDEMVGLKKATERQKEKVKSIHNPRRSSIAKSNGKTNSSLQEGGWKENKWKSKGATKRAKMETSVGQRPVKEWSQCIRSGSINTTWGEDWMMERGWRQNDRKRTGRMRTGRGRKRIE